MSKRNIQSKIGANFIEFYLIFSKSGLNSSPITVIYFVPSNYEKNEYEIMSIWSFNWLDLNG